MAKCNCQRIYQRAPQSCTIVQPGTRNRTRTLLKPALFAGSGPGTGTGFEQLKTGSNRVCFIHAYLTFLVTFNTFDHQKYFLRLFYLNVGFYITHFCCFLLFGLKNCVRKSGFASPLAHQMIRIMGSVPEKEIQAPAPLPPGDDFFYLKEPPLRGNFSDFKKKLLIGTFFIDPQKVKLKISKNHSTFNIQHFCLRFSLFHSLSNRKK